MNFVGLTGRTTRDFDTYTAKSGTMIAKTNIAVTNPFDKEHPYFIPITVFGKTAEFCDKYVHKGDLIEVSGRLVPGEYTKSDGTKVHTMDVNADVVQKLSSPKKEEYAAMPKNTFDIDTPF